MKEKIVIKNFSVLDEVELEINKINILIGPQAAGKTEIQRAQKSFKKNYNTELVVKNNKCEKDL